MPRRANDGLGAYAEPPLDEPEGAMAVERIGKVDMCDGDCDTCEKWNQCPTDKECFGEDVEEVDGCAAYHEKYDI